MRQGRSRDLSLLHPRLRSTLAWYHCIEILAGVDCPDKRSPFSAVNAPITGKNEGDKNAVAVDLMELYSLELADMGCYSVRVSDIEVGRNQTAKLGERGIQHREMRRRHHAGELTLCADKPTPTRSTYDTWLAVTHEIYPNLAQIRANRPRTPTRSLLAPPPPMRFCTVCAAIALVCYSTYEV